jgi:hypothetical protein
VLWLPHALVCSRGIAKDQSKACKRTKTENPEKTKELLHPAASLYNDSDSETESEGGGDICKPDPLSQYKRDLCLSVYCFLILAIVVNLLVLQYILSRRI